MAGSDMQDVDEQKELINWFKGWSDKKIFDGKDIKDFLGYDDYSFWWFMDFYIYNNLQRRMSGQIPENRKIKIFFAPIFISSRTLVRRLYSQMFMNFRKTSEKPKVMIISHRVNWKKSAKPPFHNEDQLFNKIIKRFQKENYSILGIDRNHGFGLGLLKEKRKLEPNLWTSIEHYIKISDLLYALKINRQIKKKFKKIKDRREFRESFVFQGNDLFPQIYDIMELAFAYTPLEAMIQSKSIENAVRNEDIKLIMLSHEYGTFGKAAFIAGKKTGIKTLAVQHGVLHPYHMGYLHTPNEIGKWCPNNCPLPDKMASFGDHTKDFLINDCHYPESSIAIVGQSKYDDLATPDKVYDKEYFYKVNNVSKNKVKILVGTQALPLHYERVLFFINILKLSKIPDSQLIIKPHPGEDMSWHKDIMEKNNVKAPILDPKSNIFEAIHATDILATFNSTIATEAIIMDKNVLILNLTGQKDIIPYVESGAAIGVYDDNLLVSEVDKMINDVATKARLKKGREQFVLDHFHKIDGKSTERVVNLAINMINSES